MFPEMSESLSQQATSRLGLTSYRKQQHKIERGIRLPLKRRKEQKRKLNFKKGEKK